MDTPAWLQGRALRVLVADDNRDTVLTLATLLREEGHDVRAAYTGTDVMRIARLHRFDVVILDIEMPEMSGYAVAQELRTHYYGTNPPLLIAISGKWNRPSEKLLARAVGFDHHFEKPCDPNTLLKLLQPLALSAPKTPQHAAY
jgi:CheY-like chemotaxis protein